MFSAWRGLSEKFKRNLLRIDPDLAATFDEEQDAIIVWSKRVGRPMTHEFTSRRTFKENHPAGLLHSDGSVIQITKSLNLPDLEDWTILRLHQIDVWQNHGSGKSFDDWLCEEEDKQREKMRKQYESERKAYLDEHRDEFEAAIWNAQHGRFNDESAQPYEITRRQSTGVNDKPKKGDQ